jgi:hypothetical protein
MKYLSSLLLICGLVGLVISREHQNVAQVGVDPVPIIPRKFSGTFVTNQANRVPQQKSVTMKWD